LTPKASPLTIFFADATDTEIQPARIRAEGDERTVLLQSIADQKRAAGARTGGGAGFGLLLRRAARNDEERKVEKTTRTILAIAGDANLRHFFAGNSANPF
jgi:hypothetical protein